jgi:undecaprenyl-diphosphatase
LPLDPTLGESPVSAAGLRARAFDPIVAVAARIAQNLLAWLTALFALSRRNIRPLPWRPSRLALGTFAAIGVVAVAMILIDSEFIGIEKRVPPWFRTAFNEITDFGKSGWFLWPTGLLLVALAAAHSPTLGRFGSLVIVSLVARVGFVFLAIGVPSLIVAIVKRLIGRSRPPRFSDTGPFDYLPFSWRVEYASLPSGHATSAFAAAVALGALFPRARTILWVYAILIALSRVIIAAHYPSDVIAGALAGGVGALLVRWWFAAHGLGFTVAIDGAVRAKPGPSLRRIKKIAARLVAQ